MLEAEGTKEGRNKGRMEGEGRKACEGRKEGREVKERKKVREGRKEE